MEALGLDRAPLISGPGEVHSYFGYRRPIRKGINSIDFLNIGSRNGIDFHNFVIRKSNDFQEERL